MSMQDQPAMSELYSAYAAGTLDPAFALLVETQAALRPDIGETVALGEVVAGALLETSHAAQMADHALSQALAAIDDIVPDAPPAPEETSDLPAPLQAAVNTAANENGWSFSGPGLRRMKLDISEMADAELIRIAPGAAVPRHTHEGCELTLVVQGGFSDETGAFAPGDISVKGPQDTHTPVGDDDGYCIVLAVRDGGLRFRGMMGIVQRIFG